MSSLLNRTWAGWGPRVPDRSPLNLAVKRRRDTKRLRFTEWLLILVLALAYLESIAEPLFTVQLHYTILGHFPLMVLGPVLVLHIIGKLLNHESVPWGTIAAASWPLALLALYAVIGSAFAKWSMGVTESFLAFGAYLALVPVYMCLAADRLRLRSWATVLIGLWLMVSLAALLGEAARMQRELLHEIEYLVIAGFFALYYVARNSALKLLAVLLLLAAAVLNQKITGYLIASLAMLHIVLTAGWRRMPKQWRGVYWVGSIIFAVAVTATLALLYFQFREYLPSGNPEVRLNQYEAAIRQFERSPIWGNAYLDGSGEVYRESYRALNIPTHSDVLDLLKHGGLIALGLFALGYWKIYRVIERAVVATRDDRLLNAYFVSARFFLVTALVTFSFNPLLLKGPFLIVIWANLGLAAGIAIGHLGQPRRPRKP